jgi:hypothetical protein
MQDIIKRIINKPMHSFSSIYGYLLDIQIGEPILNIRNNKDIKNKLKELDYEYYAQEYYYIKIVGEFTLDINSPWDILYNNEIIFNADQYDHSKTNYLLGLYLAGHKIIDIININNHIDLKISNNFIMRYYDDRAKNYYFNIHDNINNKWYVLWK